MMRVSWGMGGILGDRCWALVWHGMVHTEEDSKVSRFTVDEGFEDKLDPDVVLGDVRHTEEFQEGVKITKLVLQWS